MASVSTSTSSLQSLHNEKALNTKTVDKVLAKPEAVVALDSTKPAASAPTKYRHVAAVHARSRTSLLSSGYEESMSFLGFRNLMVIVLSKFNSARYRQGSVAISNPLVE